MAKGPKTVYSCTECGAISAKWQGKCSACGAWNTLVESIASTNPKNSRSSWTGSVSEVVSLPDVNEQHIERLSTGFGEFDRVLGGGMAKGSVVLIGGDPGVGKSTLIMQACGNLAKDKKVLYCTGEESQSQVADRAKRLGFGQSPIRLLAEIECERILATAQAEKADVLIVDSIQTVYTGALESAPGSVAQVRESASLLTRMAKSAGVSVILVGHVTKEGSIAGPRVLEHMVDTVLALEGDNGSGFRILRADKNRFGAANELGIFAMESTGLREVTNASELFVTEHAKPVAGSAVHAAMEGSRPFLVEVQCLVETTASPNAKRHASGFETSRLQLLLAILNKHAKLPAFDQNVYLKVVGGVRLTEPAADLSAMVAAYSSLKGKALPKKTIVFGEVGLAGEIRNVQWADNRLKEAAKLGYENAILPASCKVQKESLALFKSVKQVKTVSEVIEHLRDLS